MISSVRKICNRVGIVSKGNKVAEGTVAELKSKHHSANLEEVFMKVALLNSRSEQVEKILHHF